MIDMTWWLTKTHEEVEDLGNGMYRHIFTSPDGLKLYLPKPLVDRLRRNATPDHPTDQEEKNHADI